jgi:perosamine synthetase
MCLKALCLQPGDDVLCPAFTFIATANSILYQGIRPTFVDVDPATFNIDPDDLAEKITPKTKAVIGVHLYGHPFDLTAVSEICQDNGVAMIEDAAQAHGSLWKGKKVGGFGIGCFSFYPTKNMTTGEGGMITTNDQDLAQRLRLLRNHGDAGKYDHVALGYNYRMTDIQGAIGKVQLGKLDGFNGLRIKNAEYYNAHISSDGLSKPYRSKDALHVYHQYVLKVDPASGREEFMKYLNSLGIGSAIHYPKPVYRHGIYQSMGMGDARCPVSEMLSEQVVSIPVHPALKEEERTYIVDMINARP